MEKNICMSCGRKSKNRFEYRVLDKYDVYRDFCSIKCLFIYYMSEFTEKEQLIIIKILLREEVKLVEKHYPKYKKAIKKSVKKRKEQKKD